MEEKHNKEENIIINKTTWKKEIFEWLKSIIFAFIMAIILMKYVVFVAIVPTGSMIPTININEKIIVWKVFKYFDWDNRGLTYGDLVVFKAPDEPDFEEDQLLVKRVIGMSGDVIRVEGTKIYRNNEILEEPYVKNHGQFIIEEEIVVPDGEIFVLGDNRGNSYDSRFWNDKTISIETVVGEVKLLKVTN